MMSYRVWIALFMVCMTGLLKSGTTIEELAAIPEIAATYRSGKRPELAAQEAIVSLKTIIHEGRC